MKDPSQLLEEVVKRASKSNSAIVIPEEIKKYLELIAKQSNSQKGVLKLFYTNGQ